MTVFFGILFLCAGAAVAFLLNKLFANKIENKKQRLALKAASYVLFISFSLPFALDMTIKQFLDKFIDNRIYAFELALNKNFPNTRVMEININTKEFTAMSGKLRQSLKDVEASSDGFFEKMAFDAFMSMLMPYVNAADSGVNAMAAKGGKQGNITMKSVLLNLKEVALNKVSRYFVIFEIFMVIIFFVCICVYIGVAIFLRKKELSHTGTNSINLFIYSQVERGNQLE